ncbi:MAG TPA: hypothetical protein VJQ57_13665 [Acidimicrobiia bacterium]|nr:hypothetical protein [Acidimicrobiia bacterium]
MSGFKIGDYVIADRALYDTFTETFVITGFGVNAFGRGLIEVRAVGEPRSVGTSFYPDELSYEDGSRP